MDGGCLKTKRRGRHLDPGNGKKWKMGSFYSGASNSYSSRHIIYQEDYFKGEQMEDVWLMGNIIFYIHYRNNLFETVREEPDLRVNWRIILRRILQKQC